MSIGKTQKSGENFMFFVIFLARSAQDRKK
jgi:hypothetical protein